MIATTQGVPNWYSVASNAAVILGALAGFYRYGLRSLNKFVNEQIVPPLAKHVKNDKKQFRATNKMLRKLAKWQKRGDARFRDLESRVARMENTNGQVSHERAHI